MAAGDYLSVLSHGLLVTDSGSCDYPVVGDVRLGTAYASGASTGTLVLPAEDDVRLGVGYGEDGAEFTGTLVVPGPVTLSDARLIQVADAVRELVWALWSDSSSPPSGTDACTRVYEVPLGDKDSESNVVGRQVYVFPAEMDKDGEASRLEEFREYRIVVLVAERYTSAGAVPKTWVDARVAFLEQIVWGPLIDPREAPVLGSAYPRVEHKASEVEAYDLPRLREGKLYLGFVDVTFREITFAS